MEGAAPRKKRGSILGLLCLLAIPAATFIAYIPAVQGGFIWDDDVYVVDIPALNSPNALERIWLDFHATPQYYPLVFTMFWAERQLWGLDPLGFHIVNVALQALVGILLWRVLKRIGVPGAWLAGALFALHPVHVESVAWITERKNVLSGVFYLSAALCYIRFAAWTRKGNESTRHWGWYAGALICFACSLLSKTAACTWPAAMLVVRWWQRGRIKVREIVPLVPMFAIAIAMGLITAWVEKERVGAEGARWDSSMIERTLVAGRALWFYLWKLVWPANLSFIYYRWTVTEAQVWAYLFPIAAAALVAVLFAFRKRLGRGPLAATLYFGGTLLPALGFINVYMMQYSFVADHLQYLASMGPITLGAALLARLGGVHSRSPRGISADQDSHKQRRSPWGVIIPGVILGIFGVLTWRQGYVYRDLETLWRDTLAKNPSAWIAHTNLANLVHERGNMDEAEQHYRRALELNPKCVQAIGGLGVMLGRQGRTDEAIEYFEQALSIRPEATQHRNLGVALAAKGKIEEAIPHFAAAVRALPESVEARMQLGNALMRIGRLDDAIDQLQQAVHLEPMDTLAHSLLGDAFARAGRTDEAIAAFERALAIDPTLKGVRQSLARLKQPTP